MIKNICKILVMTILLSSTAMAEEKVRAEHILVKTAAQAQQIKKDIENGGSFEYYARMYSLCPSGQNGGDLGYFRRGQMVREFEKVAFSIPVGEISNPIYTQFGWHLIKVIDRVDD